MGVNIFQGVSISLNFHILEISELWIVLKGGKFEYKMETRLQIRPVD